MVSNVWLEDQVQAAAKDAAERVASAVARHGLDYVHTPMMNWLRQVVQVHSLAVRMGWPHKTCGHLEFPQPVVVFAWEPRTSRCLPCAEVQADDHLEAVTTCQRCKTSDAHTHLGIAAVGSGIFQFFLCGPCRAAVAAGEQ